MNLLTKSIDNLRKDVNKSDSLLDVFATFYTPRWSGSGDGKNGNDSWLDIVVTIKTTSGQVYRGEASVLDNSPVDRGNSISPHIAIKDAYQIKYDSITEVSFVVGYIKKDYVIDLRQDFWKVRAELVLSFSNNRYLSTGYNNPVGELNFTDVRHTWEPKQNPRYRSQLNDFITINAQSKD